MRYTSRSCSCSFSYDITCPALRVPEKPSIISPANGTVLNCLYLNQCGSTIWAFGDTLAAVNGIVTGTDSSLDAACTHACCVVRCNSCADYWLHDCCDVYGDPGVFYHRIRYVTSNYEIS